MSDYQYTTMDRIFSKLSRDLKGESISESDIIEWTGEALDFLKVAPSLEQSVLFVEVENYEADLPQGLHHILQVARDCEWAKKEPEKCVCPGEIIEDAAEQCVIKPKCPMPVAVDCQGKLIGDFDVAYYRPYFDLQWEYGLWTRCRSYKQRYTPVRLANHSFFGSMVLKEKDQKCYRSCENEYTIIGTMQKKLRFSFKEGSVAIAHLRSPVDPNSGLPLIPDNVSHIAAITYYIKWKMAERYQWNQRDGFKGPLTSDIERKWLKYVKQAKNHAKMPKTLDQYQNLLEASHHLIPNHRRYYNFFGKLGRPESRVFNDPDYRNKNYY